LLCHAGQLARRQSMSLMPKIQAVETKRGGLPLRSRGGIPLRSRGGIPLRSRGGIPARGALREGGSSQGSPHQGGCFSLLHPPFPAPLIVSGGLHFNWLHLCVLPHGGCQGGGLVWCWSTHNLRISASISGVEFPSCLVQVQCPHVDCWSLGPDPLNCLSFRRCFSRSSSSVESSAFLS
jgi:hypothetical protein